MNTSTNQTTSARLHFRRSGAGDAVVLIHGFPQTSHEWHKLTPLLATHFTFIAPDLRGLGDSEPREDGYDKRTLAEDVTQLTR